MFGLIDRQTKEARVRCALNNGTKEKLLPSIRKYVKTNNFEEEEVNVIMDEEESNKKRILSDCYQSYLVFDFKEYGYILKRANHRVWFGKVCFTPTL